MEGRKRRGEERKGGEIRRENMGEREGGREGERDGDADADGGSQGARRGRREGLFLSPIAAAANHHILSGLNIEIYYLTVLELRGPK